VHTVSGDLGKGIGGSRGVLGQDLGDSGSDSSRDFEKIFIENDVQVLDLFGGFYTTEALEKCVFSINGDSLNLFEVKVCGQ